MAYAARGLLSELGVLRARTRSRRQAYWLPLVLFGLLGLGLSPLYVADRTSPPTVGFVSGSLYVLLAPIGGWFTGHPMLIATGWLVGIPVVCLVAAIAYRRHATRVGIAGKVRPFVLVALLMDASLLVLGELRGHGHLPWQLAIHGLIAWFVVVAGLAVLAWNERSLALALITLGLLAITLLVTLYDTENLLFRLGLPWSEAGNDLPNPLLPAVYLLVAGAVARGAQALAARR